MNPHIETVHRPFEGEATRVRVTHLPGGFKLEIESVKLEQGQAYLRGTWGLEATVPSFWRRLWYKLRRKS